MHWNDNATLVCLISQTKINPRANKKMEENVDKICLNCKWWVKKGTLGITSVWHGECHFNPPNSHSIFHSSFPSTNQDDFCKEFTFSST